jgi:polyhydroxybutyrate depolymerase
MRALCRERRISLGALLALVCGAGCSSTGSSEPSNVSGSSSGASSTTPSSGLSSAVPSSGVGSISMSGGGAAAGSSGVADSGQSGGNGNPSADGGGSSGIAGDAAYSDVATVSPLTDGGFMADGAPPPVPTAGCGTPANQALGRYVRKNTMVGTRPRDYSVYLPLGYDPMRPYRAVFLGHGCGGNGGVPFPFETASKGDAIIVGLDAVGPCFDVNGGMSTELPYFDQALKELSSTYCVDKSRVFMAGFSAGSWLANLLGCARAGVLRGQGNAEGNLPPIPACTGPIAAMMAHDQNDTANDISGSIRARDRLLAVNGCSQTTLPYAYDGNPATPSPCVIYQGCMPGYPVVWCPTKGKGHSPQVPLTTIGLWRFWSQF